MNPFVIPTNTTIYDLPCVVTSKLVNVVTKRNEVGANIKNVVFSVPLAREILMAKALLEPGIRWCKVPKERIGVVPKRIGVPITDVRRVLECSAPSTAGCVAEKHAAVSEKVINLFHDCLFVSDVLQEIISADDTNGPRG